MRSATRLLGLATVAGFFALAFTPLPNRLHRAFAAPARLGPADAIVVLGAGGTDDYLSERSLRRAVHGMRLFHRGLAPVLVLHGSAGGSGPPEADTRAALARDLGLPPGAIVVTGGLTTRDEARQSWSALSRAGRTRILLVTGSHHMWRAHAMFERQGFTVLAAPVEEVAAEAAHPELRLAMARSVFQEGMARLVYRLAGVV
jgi:uncharacterized SAM-binding protein YcdF (DUF218 family)